MELGWIADALGARAARRVERIQSLWSGYGELFRIALDGGATPTAVVKWARPPAGADDVSARRKRRSFDVETAFYREVAPRCDASCRVPALLASHSGPDEWVLVLEDLDAAGFDRRRDDATGADLDGALAWLASFHARFVDARFDALWPVGTYWHLETRRDELARISDRRLREAAPVLAARLAGARYQTLVHGDAKDANFCFGARGVAAVDFQYTGRGAGIVDVAYLLHGRREAPLDAYFAHLRQALRQHAPGVDATALAAEWRSLYDTARLDFERFLAGWRR